MKEGILKYEDIFGNLLKIVDGEVKQGEEVRKKKKGIKRGVGRRRMKKHKNGKTKKITKRQRVRKEM